MGAEIVAYILWSIFVIIFARYFPLSTIDIVAYIPWLVFVIIIADYFLLPILNRHILRVSKDDYIWIRREFKLLEALFNDHKSVVSSVDQLKKRANQFWDSELGVAGISLRLDETQTKWLVKAGDIASKAKRKVEEYEKVVSRGDLLKTPMPGVIFIKLLSTIQLAREMKKAKREINDHLGQLQISGHNILESLELSKSRLRSLQEGPTDESNHPSISSRPSFRSGAALISTLRCLKAQKPYLVRGMSEQVRSVEIQLMLLYAFMKDLRGLWLEREIENAWVTEAQLIIIETEKVIDSFFRRTNKPVRWIPVLHMWIARRKLKKKIKHLFSRAADLLEDKEKYDFKFVRRESSRFAHPHPLQPGLDDTFIASAIESICASIDQAQETNKQIRGHVGALCNQLEQTDELLRDTRATEGARNTRVVCFEQLKRLASDAVDSTNMYTRGRLLRLFLPFLSRSKFTWEILEIEQVVSMLKRSIKAYSTEIVKDSSVVGLEADIHLLVQNLITGTAERQSIFSIVGMKGIGKTTLAKKIYNHMLVVNKFDFRHWFSLPQESDEILLVIEKVKEALKTWEEQQERKQKHYLLVLDNLISEEAWDVLKQSLAVVKINGPIKIVITTRYKNLASYVGTSSIHQLRLRTKEESWELFTQMVPVPCEKAETSEEKELAKKVEALAKKVVGRTGGLPLAILYLGYLFSVKKVNLDNLSRVLERVTQGQNQLLWLEAWNLNKEDLQSQHTLAQCLSYFESFPIDFEIPARRLVAVLVARGLVADDKYETRENVAYACLSELISRNMIQVVEQKLNGDVKSCRFPSPLRELWQQRKPESWPIRSWYLISTSLEGQLTYHFDDSDATFSHRIPGLGSSSPNFLHEERDPLSIMFFDTREGSKPGEDIGNFLRKGIRSECFQNLLVLDLEGVFRPNLPKNIGALKQLTYLGLRWTYLEKIPPSIGKLLNLQTLDVKYTYIRTLPISVWKLKKLQHLYLNEYCQIKFMPKPSDISLKDLQTLLGVFLDEDSPLKDGLDKLNNLQKLGLSFQLSLPQQEVLERSILQLTCLQSLSLSSVNERNYPQGLRLEHLSDLKKLSSLYLFGKLEPGSIITSRLPESLTELILSASQLPNDSMENLGQLPKLKSLSFFSRSYQGRDMVFSGQSFPQLLVLKLWSLDNLESVNVEEGAMKNLREMEIRSCKHLTVTNGLTHLETLQELKLTNMPENYETGVRTQFAEAIEISRIKIIHCPRIKIVKFSPGDNINP